MVNNQVSLRTQGQVLLVLGNKITGKQVTAPMSEEFIKSLDIIMLCFDYTQDQTKGFIKRALEAGKIVYVQYIYRPVDNESLDNVAKGVIVATDQVVKEKLRNFLTLADEMKENPSVIFMGIEEWISGSLPVSVETLRNLYRHHTEDSSAYLEQASNDLKSIATKLPDVIAHMTFEVLGRLDGSSPLPDIKAGSTITARLVNLKP